MFTIKNAIKNIYRYKSKYIFFGVIFFVFINIASILIGIFVYTEKVIESLKTEYAGTVKISKNENAIETMKSFEKNDFLELNNNKNVRDVNFINYIISTFSMGLYKYDIDELNERFFSPEDLEKYKNDTVNLVEVELSISENKYKLKNLYPNSVYIMGYNFHDLDKVRKSRFIIEKGKMYENDNECVVAVNNKIIDEEWNLLNIGDTIKISADTAGISKEYTVVGILKEDSNLNESVKTRVLFTTLDSALEFKDAIDIEEGKFTTNSPVNNPIEPGMINPLKPYEMPVEGYEVLVNLNSYEYYGDFQEYVRQQNDYNIFPVYENFQTILNILNESHAWSIIFIFIIFLLIIFITIIITLILLNNRKYEIAVLRSVGMKKNHLIISYLIEIFTFICGITALSFVSSQFITPIFKRNILTSIQDFISDGNLNSLTVGLNFNFSLYHIGIVFGGMTVIVMLSMIIACINIIRFEPLKIFNKRY